MASNHTESNQTTKFGICVSLRNGHHIYHRSFQKSHRSSIQMQELSRSLQLTRPGEYGHSKIMIQRQSVHIPPQKLHLVERGEGT